VNRITVAVLFGICCAIVPRATAQKNELSGLIGRTFISNQTIENSLSSDNHLRFGDGLSFEGNYARRIINMDIASLALELPVVVNPDEDLNAAIENNIPKQYRSFMVTPSVRLNLFPHVAVSPWVSVGGGLAHYDASSTLYAGGKNPGNTTSNSGTLQAGAGLDVKLAGAFSLRGEFRDFWSGVPPVNVVLVNSRQHNLFLGVGAVWHF
jgi:hypothetical protein